MGPTMQRRSILRATLYTCVMSQFVELTGRRFCRLVVLSRAENGPRGHRRWMCRCDCGAEIAVRAGHLNNGEMKSCGCLRRDTSRAKNRTHGASGERETSTYRTWRHMRERCVNPNNRDFKDYGGRGISVCERWNTFGNFLADMGERHRPRRSIESTTIADTSLEMYVGHLTQPRRATDAPQN